MSKQAVLVGKKRSLRIKIWTLTLLLFFIFSPGFGRHQLLEPPKPTHTEKGVPGITLKIVKEIKPDFDKDLFFALPTQVMVGPEFGKDQFYLYVYDYKLVKIFIFNQNFEYAGQFLEHGAGPGEVDPGHPGHLFFYAAPDNNFYVIEYGNIIQFSAEGKFKKEYKIPYYLRSRNLNLLAFDEKRHFYMHSTTDGIVDEFDSQFNRIYTYLNNCLNQKFIVYEPDYENYYKGTKDLFHSPNLTNSKFGFSSDGHLIIYLYRSSTVFIFKGHRLVRTFDIIIDRTLPIFVKRAEVAYEFQNNRKLPGIRSTQLFANFFVDQDGPYFYLFFNDEDKSGALYKFDLEGKLVGMIKKINAAIRVKRHNLYFGLDGKERYPKIFGKEET